MTGEKLPRMHSRKSIFHALLWGQFGVTFRGAVCFLLGILIARWLAAQQYGLYASFLACLDLLITLTAFGISPIFNNFIPKYQESNSPGECSYMVRWLLLFKFAVHAVCALIVLLLGERLTQSFNLRGLDNFSLLLAIALMVRGSMNGFNFAVVGQMQMKYYSLVEVVATAYQFAGVMWLKWVGFGAPDIIVLIITVNALQLFGFAFCSRNLIRPKPKPIDTMPVLRFGATTWLTALCQQLIGKSAYSLLILYFLKNQEAVAYFDVAHIISFKVGFVLLASVNLLELPILSRAYTRGGLENLRVYWIIIFKGMVILTVPLLVFISLSSGQIIRLIYTEEYAPAANLLFWLAGWFAASMLFGLRSASGALYPLGKENYVFFIRGAVALFNLVLGVILIPAFGILGAVFGAGISMLAGNIIEFFVSLSFLKSKVPWKFISSMAVIVFLASIPLWTLPNENFIPFVATSVLYFLLAGFLIIVAAPFDQNEMSALKEVHPGAYSMFEKVSNSFRKFI